MTNVSVYVIDYGMDLYNDFTYFLENPGDGDQFHQKDRRIITGVKASQTLFKDFGRRHGQHDRHSDEKRLHLSSRAVLDR